jgi:hypothetical protein
MQIIKRTAKPVSGILLLLAAIFLSSSGCSRTPSEGTGHKMLERQIQNQSNGKIKLVSFRKTNGMEDGNFYQLEYEAQIQFLAAGAWNRGNAMDPPAFEFSNEQLGSGATAQLLGAVVGANNVRQGDHATVKGAFRFQRTEKGWLGQDGQLY